MRQNIEVSIIIPCRNEEMFIGKSLDSIIENDFPKETLEVLVVDGKSDDATFEVISEYVKKYDNIRLFENEAKTVPYAMNIGIKNARGKIIVRMDAHTLYDPSYISQIVYWLEKSGADNVGGRWETLPGDDTIKSLAIAIGLSHPIGVGNSTFRLGGKEPVYVDTVPFGAYKKEIFDKIGLFDEEFVRNQDDEFNLRLTRNGGKILLVPDIVSSYYARTTFTKLWKMCFQYGYWKIKVLQKHKIPSSIRQLIPPFFVFMMIVSVGLVLLPYTLVLFIVALVISLKENKLKLILYLPFVFAILHISYGTGFLKGICDFIIAGKTKLYEEITR